MASATSAAAAWRPSPTALLRSSSVSSARPTARPRGRAGEGGGGGRDTRRAHSDQGRLLRQAPVHHIGTPWVEGTASGKPDQAGRLTRDRLEPFGGGGAVGNRLQQAFGVRMVRP